MSSSRNSKRPDSSNSLYLAIRGQNLSFSHACRVAQLSVDNEPVLPGGDHTDEVWVPKVFYAVSVKQLRQAVQPFCVSLIYPRQSVRKEMAKPIVLRPLADPFDDLGPRQTAPLPQQPQIALEHLGVTLLGPRPNLVLVAVQAVIL